MDKREFLRTAGVASLGMMFGPGSARAPRIHCARRARRRTNRSWASMRAKFKLTPDYINLENGYYCFQPEEVLAAFIQNVRTINLEERRTTCARAPVRRRTRDAHAAGRARGMLAR